MHIATMVYVYAACALHVTIISTGGKFQLVSNFMELHTLTLVALSYVQSFWYINALTSISTCVPLSSSSSCPANTFCMMSCSPTKKSLTCSACSEPSSAGPTSKRSSCPTSVLTAWVYITVLWGVWGGERGWKEERKERGKNQGRKRR